MSVHKKDTKMRPGLQKVLQLQGACLANGQMGKWASAEAYNGCVDRLLYKAAGHTTHAPPALRSAQAGIGVKSASGAGIACAGSSSLHSKIQG